MSIESRKEQLVNRLIALQSRCDKLRNRYGNSIHRIQGDATHSGLQVSDRDMTLLERMLFAVETAMESPEASHVVLEDNLNRLGV